MPIATIFVYFDKQQPRMYVPFLHIVLNKYHKSVFADMSFCSVISAILRKTFVHVLLKIIGQEQCLEPAFVSYFGIKNKECFDFIIIWTLFPILSKKSIRQER